MSKQSDPDKQKRYAARRDAYYAGTLKAPATMTCPVHGELPFDRFQLSSFFTTTTGRSKCRECMLGPQARARVSRGTATKEQRRQLYAERRHAYYTGTLKPPATMTCPTHGELPFDRFQLVVFFRNDGHRGLCRDCDREKQRRYLAKRKQLIDTGELKLPKTLVCKRCGFERPIKQFTDRGRFKTCNKCRSRGQRSYYRANFRCDICSKIRNPAMRPLHECPMAKQPWRFNHRKWRGDEPENNEEPDDNVQGR